MGNKQSESTIKFNKMIADMKKQQHQRVNIHPQKKYLMLMMEQIGKAKLPSNLKQMVVECLTDKLSNAQLIQSITSINVLKNNQFQIPHHKSTSFIRQKPQSKNVNVNFGLNFVSKILGKIGIAKEKAFFDSPQNLQQTNQRSFESQESKFEQRSKHREHKQKKDDKQIRQKLKNIAAVMKKEVNRISHPFGKLNKTFAQYIHEQSPSLLVRFKSQDQYQKAMRDVINQWCLYLQSSCLNPYRKWIISYSGIQEGKYSKWIRSLIVQQIWAVNNGYLFSMLAIVINSRKTKLMIDYNQLQYNAALLTPTLFNIDTKLQIQGHFFDSIYQMSEVVSKVRPQQILTQLQTVKKRVCTDIDNYHRLNQRGQIYEIDSDNILGIVAYILCKISSRIDQINTCLIFLRIIYGDNIYFSMGISSYMFSTIFGATQFLQSEQFKEMIQQKNNNHQAVQENKTASLANKSETKGTLSQKQQIFDKSGQQNILFDKESQVYDKRGQSISTGKELLSSSLLIVPKHQDISNL